MSKYENQKKTHAFLLQKFVSFERFTKEEFEIACEWPKDKDTFSTYWTKQFRKLLVPGEGNTFRVAEVFRQFVDWEQFQTHVTQNKSAASDYKGVTYEWVMMFEFFMPLANEGYLRTSLDTLFYKDTVKRRLKASNISDLKKHFPEADHLEDDAYLERLCKWVSKHFGGYSVGHVSGRFKVGELKTLQEAYEVQMNFGRYLIDETTAIVRFIIPFGQKTKIAFEDDQPGATQEAIHTNGEEEAARIRYFFRLLFIQHIVEAVSGEDEIWLLESGFRSKLHVWSKS